MNKDDLVLVSIDDHVVEPPDMFLNHVPAKYKAEAPIVVTDDKGVDQWMYQGRPQGVSGLNAVVSWPPEEWGRDPAGFAEMRPGVYDVHERVRDMDRNGILASMCFPTFTGFSARHLNMHREEVTLVMVAAYNDWHIDEWAGSYPDRFIPIAVLPTWNPEAMCAEIRRVAAKGCRAVTMPELPHLEGPPSYHDDEYWGPVFRTLSEENVVMCLHIGTGFGAISMAPNAPIDNMIILATQVSAMCAQDLLWGPQCASTPISSSRSPRVASAGSRSISIAATGTTRTRSGCAVTSATSCQATFSESTRWRAMSPTRRRSSCATRSASTSSRGSATIRTPTASGPTRPSRCWPS